MAVSLGPNGLVLDNVTLPNNAGGTVLQAKVAKFASALGTSAVTVAANTWVDLMSITMTTQANSRVMMWFDSHQTELGGTNANPNMYFEIDGSQVSTDTNHYFYQNGGRTVISKIFMSDALSAGSHTFKVRGSSYGYSCTWNFQNSNGGIFMVQEIAE